MASHTPTPWRRDGRIIAWADPEIIAIIATTDIGGSSGFEQQANASFIVRACNAHDALLEALQETWRVIDAAGLSNLTNGVQLGQTAWYVKASDAREMSMAAISNATEGRS